MEAIYSLLRNNKTCGPFSVEQLSCMALTADDLVWVEGSSMKWNKPHEVEGLKETFLATIGNAQAGISEGNQAEAIELVVRYSRSLEDIKSEYYLWKEKEQIKRSGLSFHYQTVPLIIILLVFLSLLFFKGADKNYKPYNYPTASVQVEMEPNPLGNVR